MLINKLRVATRAWRLTLDDARSTDHPRWQQAMRQSTGFGKSMCLVNHHQVVNIHIYIYNQCVYIYNYKTYTIYNSPHAVNCMLPFSRILVARYVQQKTASIANLQYKDFPLWRCLKPDPSPPFPRSPYSYLFEWINHLLYNFLESPKKHLFSLACSPADTDLKTIQCPSNVFTSSLPTPKSRFNFASPAIIVPRHLFHL